MALSGKIVIEDSAESRGDIFVTGASGIVGSAVSKRRGLNFPRLDVTSDTGWKDAFSGKQSVVHCAALASSRGISAERVKEVNVDGTIRVARIARDCGVKRFLFISSVKVFGEDTTGCASFSESTERRPKSAYGESKARAEDALMEMHDEGGFEVVILRPTVVVSAEAKGAIGMIARFAKGNLPFPVPREGNRRDFVSLDNLVDAILCGLEHPNASGKAFCITDGTPISTRELYCAIAATFGRKGVTIPVPGKFARSVAGLVKMDGFWARLFGDLEVDATAFREETGWEPGLSTLEYIRNTFGMSCGTLPVV